MKSSRRNVCMVLFCLCIGCQSLFLQKIKQTVKQAKCKLHGFGNSIFAHDHKYEDPCEQEGDGNNFGSQNGYNFNQNNNNNQKVYNQESYSEEFNTLKSVIESHVKHEHDNGYSYGDGSALGNKVKYAQGIDLNNQNKYEAVPNHLDEKTNASQKKIYLEPVRVDKIIQENDDKLKEKQEKDFIYKQQGPVELNEGGNKKGEITTTPEIDIRAEGVEKSPSSTYAPVPGTGGKNVASAKCNNGVLTAGDNTCREEV